MRVNSYESDYQQLYNSLSRFLLCSLHQPHYFYCYIKLMQAVVRSAHLAGINQYRPCYIKDVERA